MSQPTPSLLDDARRDVLFTLRSLRSSPSFALVAILCLALGIGANAAIFSVINAVLLRPMPYDEPERLVRIYETWGDKGTGSVSFPNFRDWVAQNTGFERLAVFQVGSFNLQGTSEPERIQAVAASPGLFPLLRARPLLGRTLAPGEDDPGKARVAVLSEELWRTRFGADRSLLGKPIRLDGNPYTVVGVMPASFDFPPGGAGAAVWVPYVPDKPARENRGYHFLAVVGRLKAGVSLEAATSQLAQVAARIEKDHPKEQTGRSVVVTPLAESVVGRVRPALLILFGAVALVLLIACANVANLLLARAAVRQREVAVRLALGASRRRLIRQFLLESLVLAGAGAALGLLLARWSLAALTPLAKTALPITGDIPLDGRVFAFLLAVAALSGLAFGLVPALQAARGDVRDTLTEGGGKSTSSGRQQLFRSALVVAEIAVSLILLVGAGLLMRGFLNLSGTEPGLKTENVLTAHLPIPAAQVETSRDRLFRPILENIRRLPGVQSAAVISMLPIQDAYANASFAIVGRPEPQPGKEPFAEVRVASRGFFQTLGIPVLRGRDFEEPDGDAGRRVIIINNAMARQHFPRENPLGQRVIVGGGDPFTIVGVVGDVRQAGLDVEPLPEIYLSYGEKDWILALGDAVLVVRTEVPPAGVTADVRRAIQSVDPNLPLYRVLTMEEVISEFLASRRLNLWLLGIFAGMALVLSAAGLYGVISYLVAQRTREIGVRVALGAQKRDVIGLVMRQGAGLTGAGIALGLLGALAATRVLESLLFGVSARDPITFAALAAVLALVALAATWLPARRASRVDPILAIRTE
jgi:putative ABC transport system permease protein